MWYVYMIDTYYLNDYGDEVCETFYSILPDPPKDRYDDARLAGVFATYEQADTYVQSVCQ